MFKVLMTAALCSLLACQAQAQTDAASREREMLRRAQAALRDVTAERDTLRAERASLSAQLAQAETERGAAREAAATLRPQLRRAEEERSAQREQVESLQREHAAALESLRQSAAAREVELQVQLQQTQTERNERTLSNQRLTALLGEATQARLDAEQRVADLYALSLTVIERWRQKTPAEALADTEGLIGIQGVRAENQAQGWRDEADALSRPAAVR
jgi:chromosome segregation ATPase